jgi:desulfoferrodoxin-like iron-binding protein
MNTGDERHQKSLTFRAFTARIFRLTGGIGMVNVSKVGQVFKCEICGNVVVVKEAGGGELICCGEPMVLEE